MLFSTAMAQQPRGALLVVGTPIGNLDDLSPRARQSLASADAIFCEDTRVTAKLAARFGLSASRISVPPPRERARVPELLRRLEAGQTVALVSDAGMPNLSDPGQELVAAAARAGFPVVVVPGPSAPSAALAVSGLPAVPHTFLGFLPARSGERRRVLQNLRERAETLVWFEAPHRLAASLENAAQVLGSRRACVARELTKIHEETARGSLPELAALFRSRGAGRGEATVVVEGARSSSSPVAAPDLDAEIAAGLAAGTPIRVLAREIARAAGRPARDIYRRALELSGRAPRRPETGNGEA
jgi:16S rRNA (cytidine1402-2'-O)-methyltransferase